MLMYAILDPESLSTDLLSDKAYEMQVKLFLKGVLRNLLILEDDNNKLFEKLCHATINISSGQNSTIQKLLEDILKTYRRERFVPVKMIDCLLINSGINISISKYLPYDIFITQKGNYSENKTLSFFEYDESTFERKREQYSKELSLKNKKNQEIDNLLKRVFRFSTNILICDSQIGNGRNITNFMKGIQYISSQFPKSVKKVEILTCIKRIEEGQEKKFEKIINTLMIPLKKNFTGIKFCLIIKKDLSNYCHRRLLITDHAKIIIDRGFDLFTSRGDFRQNFLQVVSLDDYDVQEYLDDWRDLENEYVWED